MVGEVNKKSNDLFLLLDKDIIQTNEDNMLYKELVLKQHSVPLSDLMQINES
jgi:hypothetical protein